MSAIAHSARVPVPGDLDYTVVEILIEELGPDTVALLIDCFSDETATTLSTLTATREVEVQLRLFHTIRGSALNLGMAEVAALASRLEARSGAGELVGGSNIALLSRRVEQALLACREMMDRHLSDR